MIKKYHNFLHESLTDQMVSKDYNVIISNVMKDFNRKTPEEKMKIIEGFIKNDMLDGVKKVLESGFGINTTEGGFAKTTPLMYSIVFDKKNDIFDYLLDEGADVNVVGGDRNIALHYAAFEGDLYKVKRLVEKGADMFVKDNHNKNGCAVAVSDMQYDVAEYLLGEMRKK